MYTVVYKPKDLKMKVIKFGSKKGAQTKFNSLMNSKPQPISISMYHNGKLLDWDGLGSHFKDNRFFILNKKGNL